MKSRDETVDRERVDRALSAIPAAQPPPGLADRAYRAAMAGESAISPSSFWERLLPLATPVAAVAAIAGIVALLAGNPIPPPELGAADELGAFGLLGDDDGAVELALADDLLGEVYE